MKKFTERNSTFDDFTADLVSAIDKYGEEHVDIILDEGNNIAYLTYHSKKDSYSVSKDYPLAALDYVNIADTFNIGWSEV